MAKLLIAISEAKPQQRKAATSSNNIKALIEKRVKKNEADTSYTVITINQKMGLKPVVTLLNASNKKLAEVEGVLSVETYKLDTSKTRGRWEITSLSVAKTPAPLATDPPSEGKPKKKKKANKGGD